MCTRAHGRGRTMALTIGHADTAQRVDGHRALLRNGGAWLVGTPVLTPFEDLLVRSDVPPDAPLLDLDELAHHPLDRPMRFEAATDRR